jgi:NADPH-dependent 2,4-dienoyl-CoA reductase/sulfur reductase-like enzyme
VQDQDVIIVGGGPAGVAAAILLRQHGVDALVIDEQLRPGGQILRQSPWGARAAASGPGSKEGKFSTDNWTPKALREKRDFFERHAGSNWLGGHSVVGLGVDNDVSRITVSNGEVIRYINVRAVLLATGCYELPFPVPGWTLSGVLGAGALQTLIKGQLTLPGKRAVFVGTHPLQLLVAAQTVLSGGEVAAVVFAQSRQALLGSLFTNSSVVVSHLTTLFPAASAWGTLHRARVPIFFGAFPVEIQGRESVQGVQLSNGAVLRCDTVAQCYGFIPQADLPRQAGARMHVAGLAGGWATEIDQWQATSRPGVYAAGETTGVAGAEGANLSGQLAALGIAAHLGRLPRSEADSLAAPLRRRIRRVKQFAAWLDAVASPDKVLSVPRADTLICRCEKVSYAEIDAGLDLLTTADALKLQTRCGMGLCQGRLCEASLLRLLKQRGYPIDPGFTAQFPARPVPISCVESNEVTRPSLL